jgi:catechol-2,3-dioxygenase
MRRQRTMIANIGRVGLHAGQPNVVAEFYRKLLGLEVILSGNIPPLGDFVFLNRSTDDNLPMVALHTREEVRYTAFQVESLGALKALYADTKANGIALSHAMNHLVSLSIYFRDPAANLVEVFWPSGRPVLRRNRVAILVPGPSSLRHHQLGRQQSSA